MQKLSFFIMVIATTLISGVAIAQTNVPVFFKNLKLIVAAAEAKDFSSLKGERLSPPNYVSKVYACTVKLEEFETTFEEKNGVLVFEAVSSTHFPLNAKALLNKEMRDKSGLEGYINQEYTGPNPGITTEKFESMTLLIKENSTQNLVLCKRRNSAGYRLYVMSAGKIEPKLVTEYDKWGQKKETPIADGKKNGIVKLFYKSGEIQVETPFINDQTNGKEKRYYISGKLQTETPFTNGKENGTQKFYYENGILSQETPHTNGKRNGIQKEYFESGKLHKETPFVLGAIDGTSKSYYENGNLEYVAHSTNSVQNGINKYYYENGKLKAEYSYKDGELIKKVLYDENGNLKN